MRKQFQLKNKMMDVVKHCETSKTSLMVKVQPTPQTQLQWLEISVWSVSRGVTLHVHSPPAEPWPRATFVLYLTARGRQCGAGDSVRSHPLSRTLAVVSGLQHQRGGTRNKEPGTSSMWTPVSALLISLPWTLGAQPDDPGHVNYDGYSGKVPCSQNFYTANCLRGGIGRNMKE